MKQLTAGKDAPKKFNALIEIPLGSTIKYEFDEESGILFADRFMFTAMNYPLNYGSIPGTKADDGDPLDVLVLSSQSMYPGTAIVCEPIGMLEMEDEEGIDIKILAKPITKVDPFSAHIQDVHDIPEAIKNKIKHFFEHYKELEPGKWVKVRDWKSREEAEKIIRQAIA